MSSNRLKLNPSKTELIWLHSSRRNPGFIQNDIELFGNFITPVRVVRNLGVILDENMTMWGHIYNSVVEDATTNFDRFVGSGSHYMLLQNFVWFLHRCIVGWTIVIVFFTHYLGLVYSCVSVLNSAARLIRGLLRFDRATPVPIDLRHKRAPQYT